MLNDTFKMYLKEISRYPLLAEEETKRLIKEWQENHNVEAYQKVVNSNLRLVIKPAKKYINQINHLQILDIIEEGNLGLLRAIDDYNPDLGSFTTYAYGWIEGNILKAINEKEAMIRKPTHIKYLLVKYLKLIEEKPDIDDKLICETLNITLNTLKRVKEYYQTEPISLNTLINEEEEESEISEFLPISHNDYNDLVDNINDREIYLVFKEVLGAHEYFIFYYRLINDSNISLRKIGDYFHVSGESIRMLEKRVKKKVAAYLKNKRLYQATLKKIKNREKDNFNKLKITPNNPSNIITYLYLKNKIPFREHYLYYLIYLSNYHYEIDDYQKIFNISYHELKGLISNLKKYINNLNSKDFQEFRDNLMNKYLGLKILKINLDSQDFYFKRFKLTQKYQNLDFLTVINLFNEISYHLSPTDIRILKKYYNDYSDMKVISHLELEKNINLIKFNYYPKDTSVSKNKLLKTLEEYRNDFSEEQISYLQAYYFNQIDKDVFLKKYPNSGLIKHHEHLVNRLERCYYHIFKYFENNFNKENWVQIRSQYSERFSDLKRQILDLYYGIYDSPKSILEISNILHLDYKKTHAFCRNARDLAINILNGSSAKKEIIKENYIPYLNDLHYEFKSSIRNILKLYIIENKTYDEIREITSLSKTKISNIIIEGIKRIDYYRFNLSSPFIISKEELLTFLDSQNKFNEQEKEILVLKYIDCLTNKEIEEKTHVQISKINAISNKFSKLYNSYLIKDILVNEDDYQEEINKHPSESLLKKEEKEFISYYLGLTNSYNPLGQKLAKEKLMVMFSLNPSTYQHLVNDIRKKMKRLKAGLLRPSYSFIKRDDLDRILDDKHLPISSKDKDLLCYLFELKDYPYYTFEEVSTIKNENVDNLHRRYYQIIVTIYKYLNHEIDGKYDFNEDIMPILKYFSLSSRDYIISYYKDELTYEQIKDKYNLTFNEVVSIFSQIKSKIYDILNNPQAKKFDFDFYYQEKDNPALPYYRDIRLAKQIFDLAFGPKRLSNLGIAKALNLDISLSNINSIINDFMLSFCKLKDNIFKENTFTYEEIWSYYKKNEANMPSYLKNIYLKYFKRKCEPSFFIINDLIKETKKDAFIYSLATKEEVLQLLDKYNDKLPYKVKENLMKNFNISKQKFLNGKEINHVYKLLNILDNSLEKKEAIKELYDKPPIKHL